MSVKSRVQIYRELSKSGIVTLVVISVFGGYLVGHSTESPLEWQRLLLTLIGVLFLASGSSALNQIQEHKLDSTMPRTAKRPLPSGRITLRHGIAFVVITLLIGLVTLAWLDLRVLAQGIAAVIFYNGLYTLWWKKRWAYAAVPGAIPGALPIWMGYVAASRQLWEPAGLYLFFILFYWQMPHFWVLALRFRDDYQLGGFPTLPVKHGSSTTVFQIILWCLGYIGLALIGPLFMKVGWLYFGVTLIFSLKLLWELLSFARAPESKKWLHFFLWVNLSLIVYVGAAVVDLWRLNVLSRWLVR